MSFLIANFKTLIKLYYILTTFQRINKVTLACWLVDIKERPAELPLGFES